MKVFLICSKHCYRHIPEIQEELVRREHSVTLPNSYHDPDSEMRQKEEGERSHAVWKAGMFRRSEQLIRDVDAVLVLNFEKHGAPNYIGGATFLEMYDAFRLGKKIFLHNPIPEGMLADEINGFGPVIINGDLSKIV